MRVNVGKSVRKSVCGLPKIVEIACTGTAKLKNQPAALVLVAKGKAVTRPFGLSVMRRVAKH
jgi:hypothetical protein